MKIECKRGFSTPISKEAHEIQSERGFSTPISKGAHGPTARHSKGQTKFNLKEVSLLLFQEGHTVRHSQPVLRVTLLSTFGVRVKPECI